MLPCDRWQNYRWWSEWLDSCQENLIISLHFQISSLSYIFHDKRSITQTVLSFEFFGKEHIANCLLLKSVKKLQHRQSFIFVIHKIKNIKYLWNHLNVNQNSIFANYSVELLFYYGLTFTGFLFFFFKYVNITYTL